MLACTGHRARDVAPVPEARPRLHRRSTITGSQTAAWRTPPRAAWRPWRARSCRVSPLVNVVYGQVGEVRVIRVEFRGRPRARSPRPHQSLIPPIRCISNYPRHVALNFDSISIIIEVVTPLQLVAAEHARHAPVVPCELPDGIQLVYVDDRGHQHATARWTDGTTPTWMARHSGPGRGPGTSGLKFDFVRAVTPTTSNGSKRMS